jgi:hypothetical protein
MQFGKKREKYVKTKQNRLTFFLGYGKLANEPPRTGTIKAFRKGIA